jgi:hypothetical protein
VSEASLFLCLCCCSQNGAHDGVALVKDGVLIEFLSYEGTFAATNGPADSKPSTDIGVSESSTTPSGTSLQKTGDLVGNTWQASKASTPGVVNAGKNVYTYKSHVYCVLLHRTARSIEQRHTS